MFVRQPRAASIETESQESWLELRDSTLFSSSSEEEGEEEDEEDEQVREDAAEPLPPHWRLLLLRESSRRDVSTHTSLSLLRCRMDSRLRMTQPRVCEW